MPFYIWHEDLQTPENGEAFFGPFEDSEIEERANDAYADALASFGNVEIYDLPDKEAASIGYINPRAYWMEQLAVIERDGNEPGEPLRGAAGHSSGADSEQPAGDSAEPAAGEPSGGAGEPGLS